MFVILFIVFGVLWFFLPAFKVIIKNLPYVIFYFVKDIINFFNVQGWKPKFYGIDIYVGLFGKGKTLSMVRHCRLIHNIYGDRVRFISNINLVDIPYVPLINFNQICELQNVDDRYDLNVIVIDEIEHVLSHRNFNQFPLSMLAVISQQRKLNVHCVCTSQRFFMTDKIWRSLCTNVIDCNKNWRIQKNTVYDAWEVESKASFDNCKVKSINYWFVKDIDYNSYNTLDMISKSSADDFISNDEMIQRKGIDFMERQTNLNIRQPKKSLLNRLRRR